MVQFYGVNNVMRGIGLNSYVFSDGGTFSKVWVKATDQWSPTNLDATWKALRLSGTQTTDGNLWNTDASYFRLKTAEIAYTFSNTPWLKRIGVSSLRMYLNGNDLIVWTHIWDDREDNSGGTNPYPVMKRFNLGLTLNF
jgi:hypothetical protein